MFIGLSAEISNGLGYAIGLVVSYIAHKTWTFESKASLKREFSKFVASIVIAYGLNLLVLVICIRVLDINSYLSQLISGGVYVVTSFFLLKYFAFKPVYIHNKN